MIRSVLILLLVSAMVVAGPVTLAGFVGAPAYAQPGDAGDPPSPPEGGLTLPWPALGLQSTMELYGDGGSSFTVPLPAGMTASRLQGMIHTPMNIDAGYLEIDDADGKFLASVNLPPADSGLVRTPFDVDISAARVEAASIDLSFTVRARDAGDRICGPAQRVVLSDLATLFVGMQSPATTIANFFPSVIDRITIYAATDANSAEQQTVLALASTLARLYEPRPIPIGVVSRQRGTAPPPVVGLERAVVVETGPPGLSVENAGTPGAYLRVSGDGEALATQVSLLASQLRGLAQAPTARVDQEGSDAATTGDTMTFSQLEVSGKSTTFLRTGNLQVGFDRATLGPRFDSVQVHLLADYTPVPADAAATVVIRSGNVVVYRTPLDQSGRLDATFDLGGPLVDRQWINLELALTYTPRQDCGPLVASLTFEIDPRSTLTMHRGGPPLGGFAAFPSEFSPEFLVALDGSSPEQLGYAARVVAALARLTQVELKPKVVDLQAAVDADTGALIVANSKAISQTPLKPPVSGDGSMVNFALPTEQQVNIDNGLGSIQAFADPSRNRSVVLVTTTARWTLVDPLFSRIDGSAGDWSQLTGDVLAAGTGGDPTNVAIRSSSNVFEPPDSNESSPSLTTYIAGGVVVVLAALAVIVYLLRRRTRASQTPLGAHNAGDS